MPSNALDQRRIRAAETQSFFRQVNERIRELSGGWDRDAQHVCECLDASCALPISLTAAEYERVRSDPNCFFVLEGHELSDVEETIEQTDRYLFVRKLGVGADVAAEHDPRPQFDAVA